jgi:N-acetyl-anhydromuramyl-L-alanine amidase AmpD
MKNNLEIIDKKIETNFKTEEKKRQILLTHTHRDINNYMMGIKYRYNGKPIRLPHYLITRNGVIIKLIDDLLNGNFVNNETINRNSIVISLENLGWLEKEPIKLHYINWIGDIYNEKIVQRKWRDYNYWQPYTDIQIENTVELCKEISKNNNIPLNCVGHNTKIKGVEDFYGIITRSNFDNMATDLSPAFNFENFINLLNNE